MTTKLQYKTVRVSVLNLQKTLNEYGDNNYRLHSIITCDQLHYLLVFEIKYSVL